MDVVKGEGWRVCARFSDFSVRNEACLNQGLEAVTDTENQVFLSEVSGDCVSDPLFSDYICDEFSASVRFVSGRESACECYNLCFFNLGLEGRERFFQVFWVRFLKTRMCESAPARLNARAMSYSQFVPGNTGTITRGLNLGAQITPTTQPLLSLTLLLNLSSIIQNNFVSVFLVDFLFIQKCPWRLSYAVISFFLWKK